MSKLLKKLKPLEIGGKKFLLRVFSAILNCRIRGQYDPTGRQWNKVLLIRHEKIGDVVIALTLVDEIKRHFPDCKVSFMASKQNAVVVRNDPRFDKIFVFKKSLKEDLRMALKARREKFDCVIDLITHDSVTSMLLTRFCGPKAVKVGIGKADHQDYYSLHLPHPLRNTDRHILDFHLDLVKVLGAEPSRPGRYVPLYINDTSNEKAREYYSSLNLTNELKIGLNISSGEPTRNWGADNFAVLAERLLERIENSELIIITSSHEYDLGLKIKNAHSRRVHIVPQGLDFIEVSAVIRDLDMLVSPDTSLVHVAGAFNVPVVALYRRFMDEYKFWRPPHQKSGTVLSENEMDVFDITVERVMDEILKVTDEFNLAKNTLSPVVDSASED